MSTSSSEEELRAFGRQALFAAALPTAIKTAIELGVFDIIASDADHERYLSAEEISLQLPKMNPKETPRMLDRVLAVLASYNVLTCKVGTAGGMKKYGAAPVTKQFVRRDDGYSLAPLAFMINDTIFTRTREHLTDAIIEGVVPFEKGFGMSTYEFAGKNPEFNKVFNETIAGRNIVIMKGILDIYKGFDNINSLVDVGGNLGTTVELIVKKHPHIKGVNFDLPHVISKAPIIPCVEHIGGDMFESVPHGDVILLKAILHNWNDEECVKILKNCWKALGEKGKVVVIEKCLSSELTAKESQLPILLDFTMLLMHSGKERTLEEFQTLGMEAGFCKVETVCKYDAYNVLELYK